MAELDAESQARARHLRSMARRVYPRALSRLYEGEAAEISSSDAAKAKSCAQCAEILVPGVTCRVRVHATKGQQSKKARASKLERRKKFIDFVASKKPEFGAGSGSRSRVYASQTQYLVTRCLNCKTQNTLEVKLNQNKNQDQDQQGGPKGKLSAKARAKKRKSDMSLNSKRTNPPPSVSKPASLSLSDFLM